MKKALFLSLTASGLLTQCNKVPTGAATAEALTSSVPVIQQHASPNFMKVVSHLELGGSSFNYADQEGMLEALAVIVDTIIQDLPEEQKKDLPAGFSAAKLVRDLGLTCVKAVGASSRRTDTGMYHSRSFAYMPEGAKGLATLGGGLAEPFLTHQVAPKGTDLALEFPLHLKVLAQESLASFLEVVPEKDREQTLAQLDMPLPVVNLSARQITEKLDARIGLFIQVDPDKTQIFPGADMPLPGGDALLVIDRLGWLLEPLKQQFLPMLNNPALPVEVVDADGVLTITFKAPMGPPPMDIQPMLRFDAKTDRLLLATRVDFLKQALEGTEKLVSQPDFTAAWAGLPSEGNSVFYASSNLLKTLRSTMRSSITLSKEPQEFKDNASKALDYLSPYLKQGQAACTANLPDGTLGMANLVLPLSQTSSLETVTTLAILSSLAVPTFNTITEKANQQKVLNEGRQIGLALMTYAADHNGQYPPTLDALRRAGLVDLSESTTEWLYNPTLTASSPGDSILLASPASTVGKKMRSVLRNDMSVQTISDEEFQSLRDDNLQ